MVLLEVVKHLSPPLDIALIVMTPTIGPTIALIRLVTEAEVLTKEEEAVLVVLLPNQLSVVVMVHTKPPMSLNIILKRKSNLEMNLKIPGLNTRETIKEE